jgi:4'-phosphopantetheinyl transferase
LAKRIKKTLKNIQVLVADTLSEQNNIELTRLIGLLPSNLQARALRYKNKRSSINYCFGRLMLMQAISDLGFDANTINQVYYSNNDKPLIDDFYFSISHSENYVTLAFSRDCQLGLDIEKIQKVELKNFKSFFRTDEWETINSDPNPLQKFYWYWIRKESILKAEDGKMNEVNDIFITSPEGGYLKKPENFWHLTEIIIADNYAGVLACDAVNYNLNISPFNSKE